MIRLHLKDIKELSDKITNPPYNLNLQYLRLSYEEMQNKKEEKEIKTRLTDLVSLIRFASGVEDKLEHYYKKVDKVGNFTHLKAKAFLNLILQLTSWTNNNLSFKFNRSLLSKPKTKINNNLHYPE